MIKPKRLQKSDFGFRSRLRKDFFLMKEKLEKYFSKELFGLAIIVFGGILLFFLLSHLSQVISRFGWFLSIFKPFFWGFVIAYFVNFFVVFFEKRLLKNIKNHKTQRFVSTLCGYLLAAVIVMLCLAIIIPQTINSISTLIDNAPGYIKNFVQFGQSFVEKNAWATDILNWTVDRLTNLEETIPQYITTNVLPYTVNLTTTITGTIINLFVAIVVSIYFIVSKERFYAQIKKLLYAHFKKEKVDRLIELTNVSNNTFSNFISGKLIDSLIIGILSFIILSIFRFPYAMLLAVIIGITNIIPFFGPIIGAIPCFFIIIIIEPAKAFWFLLFILILQQVDGNIIGPKILGYSIGLSAIWIVFAIVIGNELLGFVGMVIGVPAFAVCYMLFKKWSEKKLREKGLPTNTEDYASDENKIRF